MEHLLLKHPLLEHVLLEHRQTHGRQTVSPQALALGRDRQTCRLYATAVLVPQGQ